MYGSGNQAVSCILSHQMHLGKIIQDTIMRVGAYDPKTLVAISSKISRSSIQINPSLSISFDPFSLSNKGLIGDQISCHLA
jgi:hypothetical protein